MNRSSWINEAPRSVKHRDGVIEFMMFVRERFDKNAKILCPCRSCLNRIKKTQPVVFTHLSTRGMASTYTKWMHHREPSDVIENHNWFTHNQNNQAVRVEDIARSNDDDDINDRIPDMIGELLTAERNPSDQTIQHEEETMFASVIDDLKRELYPGCSTFSRFSFIVKLLHIKTYYWISNVAFTVIVKLLLEAWPHCDLPISYEEAMKSIHELGLEYDTTDVCRNNCVLYRGSYRNSELCSYCDESRWQNADKTKHIPVKVLWHFPLVPRLKRMFASKQTAEEAQWHLKRQPVENKLSHPADGETWKDFDKNYGWFAQDARNLRLGLATDGFNPFGSFNTSYSMWPVFIIPYNLPPWACMEQSNFMLTLLISGPKPPKKRF